MRQKGDSCLLHPADGQTNADATSNVNSLARTELVLTTCGVFVSVFQKDLEKDVQSDTSGHFKRFLTSQVTANRSNSTEVNPSDALIDAQELVKVKPNNSYIYTYISQ